MKWLTSGNMKVHQRKMNKMVRDLNENIEKDDLWRGRYIMRQKAAYREVYPDGSGAELWVRMEMLDRQTGRTETFCDTVNHFYMWNGGGLWREMNDFIVDTCKVWEETPSPRDKEYKENTARFVKEGWPY